MTGTIAVFCSVMIYVVTGRELWAFGFTASRFVFTSAVLGIASTWVSILLFGIFVDSPSAELLARQGTLPLINVFMIVAAAKMSLEGLSFRHLFFRRQSPLKRSARLMIGPLLSSTFARFACGLLGGIVMPLFLWQELSAEETRTLVVAIVVSMLFVACLAGELLERYQYFAACAAPGMPGKL